MRKNNYFMNTLTPSAHVFLMRNIIHHYNTSQNEKVKQDLKKIVSSNDQLILNENGQVVVGTPPESVQTDERLSGDEKQKHDPLPVRSSTVGLTALHHVQPNKAYWKQLPCTVQLSQLNHALMENGPEKEFLSSVGSLVLMRKNFLTLGLLRDVEGTVHFKIFFDF
nr:uncharacterized protein si:ch211-238e22.2 [Misgurnus anguillicaudatus]